MTQGGRGVAAALRQRKPAATPEAKKPQDQSRLGFRPAPKGEQPKLSAEQVEAKLKSFDMDATYGPCLGITRMQRWERAVKWGLQPPEEVKALLQAGAAGDCLWEGRV